MAAGYARCHEVPRHHRDAGEAAGQVHREGQVPRGGGREGDEEGQVRHPGGLHGLRSSASVPAEVREGRGGPVPRPTASSRCWRSCWTSSSRRRASEPAALEVAAKEMIKASANPGGLLSSG
eukprot:16442576-Heterocapsa_arctica.AAC.1